jgi:hypothetical protein
MIAPILALVKRERPPDWEIDVPTSLAFKGIRGVKGLNFRVDPMTKQLVDAGPAPAAIAAWSRANTRALEGAAKARACQSPYT